MKFWGFLSLKKLGAIKQHHCDKYAQQLSWSPLAHLWDQEFWRKTRWTRATGVLPNILCMQGCWRCFLSMVTLTFDLDIQSRPNEGPNTSSLRIWHKIHSAVLEIFEWQTKKTTQKFITRTCSQALSMNRRSWRCFTKHTLHASHHQHVLLSTCHPPNAIQCSCLLLHAAYGASLAMHCQWGWLRTFSFFCPWWPWPLTLTFKLVWVRDQTRLTCKFGTNPFCRSRHIWVTNKVTDSTKIRTLLACRGTA